ncbi:Hypothetical Protein FCC1311_007702 [Hondaea fermentalgiana]|uniref:Transmembrane protein 115 n=1 Tax=Hondaea fermentalgiana TaxID=2315210 RepID=A0A2R5G914_9STRA|nr:Hypothetical Protein FCC1311_007702 [Hondaea fermentalgiana]|eukprot:GBG24551.1 Hypothetical Protein FCC1311_007702 [Hondaea fermentalgiana]
MALRRVAEVARGAPGSTTLAAVCTLGSLYAAVAMESEPSANNVALVASNTLLMNWYLWTLLTGHLVDAALIKALAFLPAICILSVKLERAFGLRGLVVYLLTSCVMVSVLVVIMLLCELPVRGIYYFYNATFYGHTGLVVSLLVGNVRANIEDQLGSLRVKSRVVVFPAVLGYSFLAFVDDAVHEKGDGKWTHDVAFALFAFPVSFTLLKLFDFADRNADAIFPPRVAFTDDPFTLDAFFPQPLRPIVRAFGILFENAAFRLCGKCYRRQPERSGFADAQRAAAAALPNEDLEGWGATRSSMPADKGRLGARKITNPIAERRRLRALQALDQKLAQISREPEISFASDDEDDHDDFGSNTASKTSAEGTLTTEKKDSSNVHEALIEEGTVKADPASSPSSD